MQGENIICFAKDWTEDPTSNNHVMKGLARENHVLWLNSISTRTPDFSNSRDVSKIFKKLGSLGKGPRAVEPHLDVYTPIVLPFPHSSLAVSLNQRILRASLGLLRRRSGMRDFQTWTFLPSAVEYVGTLGESLVVYYCTDEWSEFQYLDGRRMGELEKDLCRKADLVFTTSHVLLERKKAYNPETHLASHGVDHAHFSKALDPATTVPDEIANLPHPIIGFFGLIEEWIDLELFAHLAEQRPDWSIVIVGKEKVDTSSLRRFKNIHLLGRKPYAELPRYCKAFDVALCPFVLNELTRNVNPIKLREYLSAGLPVVSTSLPEMLHYPEWCTIADGPRAFLAACDRVVASDSPEQRRRRSAAMANETWDAKVTQLGAHVMRVKARKQGRRP